MEILKFRDENIKNLIKRSEMDMDDIKSTVDTIVSDVKANGDEAIFKYTEKFDNVSLDLLKVTDEEIKEAYDSLDENIIEAIKKARKNIADFHKKQIPSEWFNDSNGIYAGQIIRAITSVGCYIPGGRAVYPSSILMTVVPAKIAGVERIVCTSPPQSNGKIADAILVAADISGADEIYKIGGAQAIAALAYGSESLESVEKIVGPGNIFVTSAKKNVYGVVDIDFPAGPSEVLIIADSTADAEFITYDLLAQAEHDPNSSCVLVTDSEKLAIAVNECLKEKIKEAKRREIIEESFDKYGRIILTDSIEESIYMSNEYAPEHLIIMTENSEDDLKEIKNAGSIFLGKLTPVAAGDYGSGTNHVLPTSGGAKMYSGISTETFLKKPTVQRLSKEGLEYLKDVVIPLAEYEGLYSHSDSYKVRLKK